MGSPQAQGLNTGEHARRSVVMCRKRSHSSSNEFDYTRHLISWTAARCCFSCLLPCRYLAVPKLSFSQPSQQLSSRSNNGLLGPRQGPFLAQPNFDWSPQLTFREGIICRLAVVSSPTFLFVNAAITKLLLLPDGRLSSIVATALMQLLR